MFYTCNLLKLHLPFPTSLTSSSEKYSSFASCDFVYLLPSQLARVVVGYILVSLGKLQGDMAAWRRHQTNVVKYSEPPEFGREVIHHHTTFVAGGSRQRPSRVQSYIPVPATPTVPSTSPNVPSDEFDDDRFPQPWMDSEYIHDLDNSAEPTRRHRTLATV